MSEPMTTHQIEDVLSSIRRLVSDDLRARAPVDPSSDSGDKLMLTPALRIVPGRATDRLRRGGGSDDDDDDAEWIDPFAAQPPGPFGASAVGLSFIGRDLALPAWEADEATDTDDAAEDGRSGGDVMAGTVDALPPLLPDRSPVFRSRREAEAPPAAADPLSDDDEADASRGPAVARASDPIATSRPGAGASGPKTWQVEPVALVAGEPVEDDASFNPAPDALTGTSVDARQTEADTNAADIDDQMDADMPGSDQDRFEDDDAALAILVRGIIHEELQGALGERITRNVRKLVRAEIQRVLASRDLP